MISVVIPSYNRVHILSRVLDSFCCQTEQNWECIIVDDYSTDSTYDLVQSYSKRDARFIYLLNTYTKGAQGARNCGIAAAKGEWIALFDSDDYAYPNFLEELSKKITKKVDVITSNAHMVDVCTHEIIGVASWCAEGNILKDLLTGKVYVGYNGTLIRKTALEYIGGTDVQCQSHQEYDTHIRLSQHFAYVSTNKILSAYFLNAQDTISVDKIKHFYGYTYILLKHRRLYRSKAYFEFLKKAKDIWCSFDLPQEIRTKIRVKLLLYIPELLVYIIYVRLKCFYKL